MIITCICGKEFNLKPSEMVKRKIHHCSMECYRTHNPRRMKNEYIVADKVTTLLVKTKGKVLKVLVDTDDLDRLIAFAYSWGARKDKYRDCYYICANETVSFGKKKAIPLHRFIISAPAGLVVDHINGDTLDNRKSNLRAVTKVGNGQNRVKLAKNNTSGVRGVSYHIRTGRWIGSITLNQRKIHVGWFDDIESARIAVERARSHHMPYSQEAMSSK